MGTKKKETNKIVMRKIYFDEESVTDLCTSSRVCKSVEDMDAEQLEKYLALLKE